MQYTKHNVMLCGAVGPALPELPQPPPNQSFPLSRTARSGGCPAAQPGGHSSFPQVPGPHGSPRDSNGPRPPPASRHGGLPQTQPGAADTHPLPTVCGYLPSALRGQTLTHRLVLARSGKAAPARDPASSAPSVRAEPSRAAALPPASPTPGGGGRPTRDARPLRAAASSEGDSRRVGADTGPSSSSSSLRRGD